MGDFIFGLFLLIVLCGAGIVTGYYFGDGLGAVIGGVIGFLIWLVIITKGAALEAVGDIIGSIGD